LPADELVRPRNKSKLEKVRVPPEHQELLASYYWPEVERLRTLVPHLDLSLWPHFADRTVAVGG
jgi:hypothetical protein